MIIFSEYVHATLKLAEYDTLEDGSYAAKVNGLQGVIAIGNSIEDCRKDLEDVIDGWIARELLRPEGHGLPLHRQNLHH